MKNKIIMVIFVMFSFVAFSADIVDLKPASPSYPHVVRMVDEGLMNLDNQSRFNGSDNVLRFDLAVFGSKVLDYFQNKYGVKVTEFEQRIKELENYNSDIRLTNLESSLFSVDDRITALNSEYMVIGKKVQDIISVISPDSEMNSDNEIFKTIIENSKNIAERTANEKVTEVKEETLKSITEFSKRLDGFEESVQLVNDKFDKTVEYLNTIILSNQQNLSDDMKEYIDRKFDIENTALETSLRNIANSESSMILNSIEATILSMDGRISEVENKVNKYNSDFMKGVESALNDFEARIDSIQKYSYDSTVTFDSEDLLSVKADIDYNSRRIDNINGKITDLQDKYNFTDSYIKSFENLNNYYRNIVDEINKRYDTLSSNVIFQGKKIDNLIYDYTTSVSTVNSVEPKDLDELKARIASVEQFLTLYVDQFSNISVFGDYIKNNDENISELKSRIDSESKIFDSYTEKLSAFEAQINSLASLTDLNKDDLVKIGDIKDISYKISDNEDKIKNITDTVYTNRNDVLDLKNNYENLISQVNNFDINFNELDTLNSKYEELLDNYKKIQEQNQLINPENLRNDVVSYINAEFTQEFVNIDSKYSDIAQKIEENQKDISGLNNAALKSDNNEKSIQDLYRQINEMKKPDQVNAVSTISVGLIGVAVGAFVTWFMLQSSM
ncbi:MAG TPA: hypothetical protein PLS66_00885 [Tepiditoga sp.]|nr:hypothetical protein [Tepiditoga sp.]